MKKRIFTNEGKNAYQIDCKTGMLKRPEYLHPISIQRAEIDWMLYELEELRIEKLKRKLGESSRNCSHTRQKLVS